MRIVVDTNVLIAALTKPTGSGARIVEAWREGRIEIIASEQTLQEAELVLSGGWLRRVSSRKAVERLLDELRTHSVRVLARPIAGIALRDEGDRRLVEAAVEGGASYLVTSDRELLRYGGHASTECVTAAELLRKLRKDEDGSF